MYPILKKISNLSFSLILIVLLFGCKSSNTSRNVTIFEGATLIIGDGSEPIEKSVVIVENDKIIEVGRFGEISYPDESEIINLNDHWLLPGFMDLHFHINNLERRLATSDELFGHLFTRLDYSQR